MAGVPSQLHDYSVTSASFDKSVSVATTAVREGRPAFRFCPPSELSTGEARQRGRMQHTVQYSSILVGQSYTGSTWTTDSTAEAMRVKVLVLPSWLARACN